MAAPGNSYSILFTPFNKCENWIREVKCLFKTTYLTGSYISGSGSWDSKASTRTPFKEKWEPMRDAEAGLHG